MDCSERTYKDERIEFLERFLDELVYDIDYCGDPQIFITDFLDTSEREAEYQRIKNSKYYTSYPPKEIYGYVC